MATKIITLDDLKPTIKQNVKDIVAEVGIAWEGSIYDWSFGKVGSPNVVFQWFPDLKERDGEIYFIDGAKDHANDLTARRGKKVQINRAYAVHALLMKSFFSKSPVRVAIVAGFEGPKDDAHVERRQLDSEFWYPHHIDEASGNFVVIRGMPQLPDYDPSAEFGSWSSSKMEPISLGSVDVSA